MKALAYVQTLTLNSREGSIDVTALANVHTLMVSSYNNITEMADLAGVPN